MPFLSQMSTLLVQRKNLTSLLRAKDLVIVEYLKVCDEQISRPVESNCSSSVILTTTLHKSIKKECPDTLVRDQVKTENTLDITWILADFLWNGFH